MKQRAILSAMTTLALSAAIAAADPVGSAFLYQGRLTDSGELLTGDYDMEFTLYEQELGGDPVAGPILRSLVGVRNGLFSVALDFGGTAFYGDARWLETRVRPTAEGEYTLLTPRQELYPTPYAIFSDAARGAQTVPWAGLAHVPPDFADGVDNDTRYTAGEGLHLHGTIFSITFAGSGSAATAARSDHNHAGVYAPLAHTHDASAIVSGTLNDARLSSNIPRLNAPATFTATVSAPTLQGTNLVVDPSSTNGGSITPGALWGGSGSGEGVASKRTAGGNQFGLDLFSQFISRLAIANNGAVRFNPGNAFASYGDAQGSIYVLRATSSGTSWAELLQSGSQRVTVPINSTWTFRILVSGRASNGKAAGYCFRGFIENEFGTVQMLEAVNMEDNAEDDNTWDVNVTADNYYDALVITARANTGDSARWVATVYTSEVKW